ncbi:MAG TPA: DMT family transporter [Thermohalobaculum sp.]|nr:DMT family transporter [Thermohalobaculum sp.]
MELIWIPIAILAALMQAVRTAAQKSLNTRLSTWMTTYVRSLFALPFSVVYLWIVMRHEGLGWPELTWTYLGNCFAAAAVQVIATYLLIWLFQLRNFAIGTMLSKTDVMQTAIIGSLLFSEAIDALGWVAILLTIAGVIAVSVGRVGLGRLGTGEITLAQAVFSKATAVGLATGFFFSMSYLFLREASLGLGEGGFLYRAAWTVVVVAAMQVVVVGAGLAATEPGSFRQMGGALGPCAFIGLTSAVGSVGWFTAMTLENASYVKAVGQVEVIFTLTISALYFKERINRLELLGIAVIVAGVLLFLL